MRRRSLSPPRRGTTHSRYSPAWTTTVSPGWASAAARLIVRKGLASEPSAASDPVVATWSADVMAARTLAIRGEPLLVRHPAERGRHARALVELERARAVRRVHAEPDAALPARPEAAE